MLEFYKKISGVIFFIGIGCLFLGGSIIYVNLSLSLIALSFLGAGFVFMGVVLFLGKDSFFGVMRSYGLRRFAMVAATVCLYLILFVVINFAASLMPVQWDLTKGGQHTLDHQTIDLLGGLKDDIKMTALYVGMPPKYLEDLLAQYEKQSKGKITTEIIDPLVQIGYAANFGNMINSNEKKVIVQSKSERRDVDFTHSPLNEEQLDNAIVRVTRKPVKVYFLSGHGERRIDDEHNEGFFKFVKQMQHNNMGADSFLIEAAGGIPEDCDVLVVAGATEHLLKDEEKVIQEYLEKGGDALFLVEHVIVTTSDKPLTEDQKAKNPSLNGILNNWGVKVADDVVVDLESHASGDVGSPATRNYMSHKGIVQGLDYTFYIRPRSISLKKKPRRSIRATPFVLTGSKEQSWGEKNRMLKIKFDEGVDRAGPVPISFVIFEPKAADDLSDTRIIVFTDADFLSNAYLGHYTNAQMGLNVLSWLGENDYRMFVDKKDVTVEKLYLTSQQKRLVAVILIAIPLFLLVFGLFVWLRQANK